MTQDAIMNMLREVKDPEIPLVNIVGMGIVRGIDIIEERVDVRITPTYSGCPAMNIITQDIETKLRENGIINFTITHQISPAWTTDWLDEETRQNLTLSGITPPQEKAEGAMFNILAPEPIVPCPFCTSRDTKKQSQFGATACKALYFCNSCTQPFEYFKCH